MDKRMWFVSSYPWDTHTLDWEWVRWPKALQDGQRHCKEDRRILNWLHNFPFTVFFYSNIYIYIYILIGTGDTDTCLVLIQMSKEIPSMYWIYRKGILFSKFVKLVCVKSILNIGNLHFDWPPNNLGSTGYVCHSVVKMVPVWSVH